MILMLALATPILVVFLHGRRFLNNYNYIEGNIISRSIILYSHQAADVTGVGAT